MLRKTIMEKHYIMTFKKKSCEDKLKFDKTLSGEILRTTELMKTLFILVWMISMLNLSVARQLYHLHLWKKKLVWSKCIEWGNLFARHAYWHLCKDSTGLDHCCDCVWSCRERYVCRDRLCQEKLTENQYNTAIKNCKLHRDHLCWEKFWRKIVTPWYLETAFEIFLSLYVHPVDVSECASFF